MDTDRPRRRGRGQQRAAADTRRADYRRLINTFPRHKVFSDDQVEAIHNASLRVLRDLGIRVLLPQGRQIFAKAGARVDEDTQMVFLDPDMVEEAVARAPAQFTLKGAVTDRDIPIGGNAVMFGPGAGCPNATDLDRGRRPGSLQDYNDMLRLIQCFDVIPKLAPCVEPQDIPVHLRHYDMMRGQVVLSDKVPFIYSRGAAQVEDGFRMLMIARGLSEDGLAADPWCSTVVNTNSPRQLDVPMTQGIIDFARWGQCNVITPFCLSGAMAPITIAGALTLSHAEAMAAITLAQIVRPGAPVVYGAFSSNVDMKSGAPAFGTPEHLKTNVGAGQLAARLNLPWRSGAGSASMAPDAQGTYENMLALWGAIMGGSHMIYHAAGWLEGGLTISFEKFITDVEVLQGIAEAFQPVPCDPDDIGFDAIAEVDPGGHFFAASQTMDRYTTAFYEPFVSDLSNYGQWEEAGSKTATERANAIWKQQLAEFTPPETALQDTGDLDDFIAHRRQAGGAPMDG